MAPAIAGQFAGANFIYFIFYVRNLTRYYSKYCTRGFPIDALGPHPRTT